MAWDRDSLWAKACVYMERAFKESKDDPLFGLWAALGLELLARSAVSHVSPTLLAHPQNEHQQLLHALGRGSERVPKKSLGSAQVLQLCSTLFEQFTNEHKKVSTAIINRRNEELHSGTSAFDEYPSSQWLSGFCRSCNALCECQGKDLAELFGDEEAENARELLAQERSEVEGSVKSSISAHKRVFDVKSPEDQASARAAADELAKRLSWEGHHRVACPACGSSASVCGVLYGQEQVSHDDGEVVVRQPVSPRDFECSACGLKLRGYAQLEVVGLGGRHTRTSRYTPEDYFGLVDSETFEPELEYDNE